MYLILKLKMQAEKIPVIPGMSPKLSTMKKGKTCNKTIHITNNNFD